MRPLYTIQELAHALRLQPGTVRNKLSRREDLPRSVVVGRRRLFLRMRWRLGCKLRKPVRPSRHRVIRLQPTLLSPLAGPVVLRVLECQSTDPGAERRGALRTADVRRRRSRSLERSWGEGGRIGSWALPLKDFTHA